MRVRCVWARWGMVKQQRIAAGLYKYDLIDTWAGTKLLRFAARFANLCDGDCDDGCRAYKGQEGA